MKMLCVCLFLTSCSAIEQSNRILTATADSVEAANETLQNVKKVVEDATVVLEKVKTGEIDWAGILSGTLGGAVAGGGGGFLVGRKRR